MKAYMKPAIMVEKIELDSHLLEGSAQGVEGLDGVDMGGTFVGGAADSRRGGAWDDED